MSKRSPNQCPDRDVFLTEREQTTGVVPLSAADLTVGQIWFLVETALRQGGEPGDKCMPLFGFEASDADRARIELVWGENRAAWAPWEAFARDYRRACDARRNDNPTPPAPHRVRGPGRAHGRDE